MARRPYVFRSTWRIDAGPHAVFTALEDIGGYPAWWPEIRSVTRTGPGSAAVACQAALPYRLRFTVFREVADRETGRLEARLEGDLEGTTSFRLKDTGGGATEAVFDEEVVVNRSLLRRVEPVARPLFRANHRLMMRHGEAGLRLHLAASPVEP